MSRRDDIRDLLEQAIRAAPAALSTAVGDGARPSDAELIQSLTQLVDLLGNIAVTYAGWFDAIAEVIGEPPELQ